MSFIPLSVPNIKGNELKYVSEAITTGWVSTAGEYVDKFEEAVSNYIGTNKSCSCQNGTSGIHVALNLCGVTKDDEVIVPTLTFIAAVNPVKYIGAEPIFLDCDNTLCLDGYKLEKFCNEECTFENNVLLNKKTKKHIKALVVVHVFGNIANMEKIMEVANKFNIKVIEDATESIGSYILDGKYKGKHSGTIGHVGIYSFNGNKIITTGGGGIIVSNDTVLIDKAKHLTTQAKSDVVYYTHDEIGYNYRMTNIQAGMGLAQLELLEEFITTKTNNFNLYKKEIEKINGLKLLPFRKDIRSNHWFYALFVEDSFPINRDELIKYLHEKKVQTRPIWGLIHEQKPYANSQTYNIEKAKYYIEHVINIPCSSNLTKKEVLYVIDCIKNVAK